MGGTSFRVLNLEQDTSPDWVQRLRAKTVPLPGSVPYLNVRPMNVSAAYDNHTLVAFLCARHRHVDPAQWVSAIVDGRVHIDGHAATNPRRVLRAGNSLKHFVGEIVEPDVAANILPVYASDEVLVVDKPAPLPVHPCGRFNRNTASEILKSMFPGDDLKPVHRLDADTTGLLILAKGRKAARDVARQFKSREVGKTYLARVSGEPDVGCQTANAPVGTEPQFLGGRRIDADGMEASTTLQHLRTFKDGTALLRVTPHTGRTNQIRLHLAHLGMPIVGDRPYGGVSDTDCFSKGPICLHAWRLRFREPQDGKLLSLEAPAPAWVTGN